MGKWSAVAPPVPLPWPFLLAAVAGWGPWNASCFCGSYIGPRTAQSFLWEMHPLVQTMILSPSSRFWPSLFSSPMCLEWPGWACSVSLQCLCLCSITYGQLVKSSSHRRPTALRVWSRSAWTSGNMVLLFNILPLNFLSSCCIYLDLNYSRGIPFTHDLFHTFFY